MKEKEELAINYRTKELKLADKTDSLKKMEDEYIQYRIEQ